MHFETHKIYHLYNRGNDRQIIFFTEHNYWYFLEKIRRMITPYCDILAYCLMPNHFHFLILPNETGVESINKNNSSIGMQILTRKIGNLLSSYTCAINKQENRVGSLFQQKTKAKDGWEGNFDFQFGSGNDYAYNCFNYIHQNPVKALLVDQPEDWDYSSYQEYLGIRKNSICNIKLTKTLLELPDEFPG